MFNNNNNNNRDNKKKYFDKKSYYQKRKSKLQLEAEKEKEKENQYYRKKVIQQLISFDFNYPPVDPNEGRISVENRKKNKDNLYSKKNTDNVSIKISKKQKIKKSNSNLKYKKFFKIKVKKGYKFYRIPSNNKKLINKIRFFIRFRHKRTNRINRYISNRIKNFSFSKLYKIKN